MTQRLRMYDLGATPFFASKKDQRFSYCLYVPKCYQQEADTMHPLIVSIHGTGRTAVADRDAWASASEKSGAIILAPLFPAGIIEPDDLNNYKRLLFHNIRYDTILLAIIDEIAAKYRIIKDRFFLYGFSGGAQFVHRFFLIHPERLSGIFIGAPGTVTLIDHKKDWWVGTRNIKQIFGCSINLEAMRKVSVGLGVGENDTATWEITIQKDWPTWMEGANDAGLSRIDRIQTLRENYIENGIKPDIFILPDTAHDRVKIVEAGINFYHCCLNNESLI